jgi:hypothetical protein
MIGKIVNETKAPSKFEWQDPADVGMTPKVKFNAKQMLKHFLICAGIERWARAVDGDNCCTTEAALVRTMPMKKVLDSYAWRERDVTQWHSHRELNILTTEIVIVASQRN